MDFEFLELTFFQILLKVYILFKTCVFSVYVILFCRSKTVDYITHILKIVICNVKARLNNSRSQRKILLEWIRTKVKEKHWPTNFREDWRSGITLCALIEGVVPGSCPRFDLLNRNHGVNNIKLGLSLVNKYLHIDSQLDAQEIFNCVEEAKFVYFLSRLKFESAKLVIRSVLKRKIIQVTDASGNNQRSFESLFGDEKPCFAKGMGLILAVKDRRARFNIFCKPTIKLNLMIEIVGPHNSICSEKLSIHNPKKRISTDIIASTLVAESKHRRNTVHCITNDEIHVKIPFYYEVFPNKIAVSYVPLFEGHHTLSIIWQGQHIMGSPYTVNVDPAADNEDDSPATSPSKFMYGLQYPMSSFAQKDKNNINIDETATVVNRKVIKQVVVVNGQEVILDTGKGGDSEHALVTKRDHTSTQLNSKATDYNSNIEMCNNNNISISSNDNQNYDKLVNKEEEVKTTVSTADVETNNGVELTVPKPCLSRKNSFADSNGLITLTLPCKSRRVSFEDEVLNRIEIDYLDKNNFASLESSRTEPEINIEKNSLPNVELSPSEPESNETNNLPTLELSQTETDSNAINGLPSVELSQTEPEINEKNNLSSLELSRTKPEINIEKNSLPYVELSQTELKSNEKNNLLSLELSITCDNENNSKTTKNNSDTCNPSVKAEKNIDTVDNSSNGTKTNKEVVISRGLNTKFYVTPVKNMIECWENKLFKNNMKSKTEIIRTDYHLNSIDVKNRRKLFESSNQNEVMSDSDAEQANAYIEKKLCRHFTIRDTKQFCQTNDTSINDKNNNNTQTTGEITNLNDNNAENNLNHTEINISDQNLFEDDDDSDQSISSIVENKPKCENSETIATPVEIVAKTPESQPDSGISCLTNDSLIVSTNRANLTKSRLIRRRSNSYPNLLKADEIHKILTKDNAKNSEQYFDNGSTQRSSIADGQYIDDEIPDYASLLGDYVSYTGLIGTDKPMSFDDMLFHDIKESSSSSSSHYRNQLTIDNGMYPENCQVFGSGVYYGQVGVKNNFTVSTKDGGKSFLSVGIQGADPEYVVEVNVCSTGQRNYEVLYEVSQPGYYIIFVKWGDHNIADSPFICKVTY